MNDDLENDRSDKQKRVAERARKELWNYELMEFIRHHIFIAELPFADSNWFGSRGFVQQLSSVAIISASRFVKIVIWWI